MHLATSQQIAALRAGTLDVGFTQGGITADDPELLERRLLAQPYALAVSRGSRLGRRPIRPADLDGQPWIVVASGEQDRDRWTAAYGAAGFAPNVVVSVKDWASALALVDAEVGLALVPIIYRKTAPPGVVLRPLPWLEMRARLSVVRRRGDTSPLVSQLVESIPPRP
jgi:DNA-binding transcriptional LysR family regulator